MRAALTRMTIPISIILLFSGNAVSADLVGDEQLIPPNPEIAIDTTQWGGFYLGAYGGYSWFSAKGANTTGGKKKGDGAKFGGFAGYNWQLNNDVVTGLEVLGGYSGAEESSGGVKLEQKWDAALRARLGYAFESSVLYSFAGLAVTSVEAQALTGTDSQTLNGYTLGLGWETELSKNITGRVEYGFSSYEDENFALGNPTRNNIDFQDQTINVGIGFKY